VGGIKKLKESTVRYSQVSNWSSGRGNPVMISITHFCDWVACGLESTCLRWVGGNKVLGRGRVMLFYGFGNGTNLLFYPISNENVSSSTHSHFSQNSDFIFIFTIFPKNKNDYYNKGKN